MSKPYKKKLIEVAIPLEAINVASAREKSIRHGHPSTLHLWWARRPLAACRAVLFSQLVDDPSEYVGELLADKASKAEAEKVLKEKLAARKLRAKEGSGLPADASPLTLQDCAIEIERQRLFAIIKDLVIWTNSTNEVVLERARVEIRRCCRGQLPPVYDPFSGGGSIPLEAQRLGLPAFGSDLNPVAVMIGKAMIEIPPKFRDKPPIHAGGPERNHYRNAEGLAEDIRFYGEWMRGKAIERIGKLYPQIEVPNDRGGGKATIIAWVWARTVASPDPAYSDVHVPITSSFALSTNDDRPVWIEPHINKLEKTVSYQIRHGGTPQQLSSAKEGTKKSGANFQCIFSQAAITPEYIRAAGKAGKIGRQLIAVVAEGAKGRIYLPPDRHQETVADGAVPKWRPEFTFEPNALGFRIGNYGLTTWSDFFTDRQTTALNTFQDLIQEARQLAHAHGVASGLDNSGRHLRDNGLGATAYAEAVTVYLSFALSKCCDYWSSNCSWHSGKELIRNTFGGQKLPMVWDYVEANPFSSSTGNWLSMLDWVAKVLAGLPSQPGGECIQSEAQTLEYQAGAVISTDPPYFDYIGYADLSDFFYCWLRTNLIDVYPSLFETIATPKAHELVATPCRHGGSDNAKGFFLQGMTLAISRMFESASDEYPTTIYYAFKESEIKKEGLSSTGWATFLEAVLKSGFSVVGTLPVRTEMANRLRGIGSNALATSVVVVCRKLDHAAGTISKPEFLRALRRELPSAIATLQAANISPADMPQASIGPGMAIFSRHSAVLESDDSPMSVKAALQLINKELDEYLGGIQGEFDADTRFAITWFEQNGNAAGEYGVANNIAQARGISVESVKHAGIVESAAGKVRILKRDELAPDWDPAADAHLTVWECCQHLISKLETEGEHEAAALLKRIGAAKADAVKDLAYCLYDICSNKRKDAKEATSYNALIAVWTELTRQAAAMPMTTRAGQSEMNV